MLTWVLDMLLFRLWNVQFRRNLTDDMLHHWKDTGINNSIYNILYESDRRIWLLNSNGKFCNQILL